MNWKAKILLALFLLLSFCGRKHHRVATTNPNPNPKIDAAERAKQIADYKASLTDTQIATVTVTSTQTSTSTQITGGSVTNQTVSIPALGTNLNALLRTNGQASQKLVIFFHEEGSNLHESDSIASKVLAENFDTLSVDLRIGGSQFGFENETVVALQHQDTTFITLVSDVHSSITWAQKTYSTIVITGSSESGSAVIKEGRTNPAVTKIAGFSPPNYIEGEAIYNYAAEVTKPFFVAAPQSEKGNIDFLLNGTPANRVTRDTQQLGDHGFGLLNNNVVGQEYLAFLLESL